MPKIIPSGHKSLVTITPGLLSPQRTHINSKTLQIPAMLKSKGRGFVNVVTVGDSKTGKTSLLSVFKDGTVPDTDVPGIFDTFTHNMKVDGHKVELGLWDTSGDDQYAGLRRLSYPNCDVFIVCYSVASRRSFENVESKWLPEVRKEGPMTPVILVATKRDLRPRCSLTTSGSGGSQSGVPVPVPKERFVEFDEGMSLANKIGAHAFLECSAHKYQKVHEIFESATKAVLQSKDKKKNDKSGKKGNGFFGMSKK